MPINMNPNGVVKYAAISFFIMLNIKLPPLLPGPVLQAQI
jgi:hypothetical protein